MRIPILTITCSVLLALPALAQSPTAEELKPMAAAADPAFEVATIKPSDPNDQSSGFHMNGHRLFIENQPVTQLICFAYSLEKSQIVNAPSWFEEAHWDVEGVPDAEGYPNNKQYRSMVEKLLKDRFGLQMHHDQRELSIYTLTVARGGPKMDPSKRAPDAPLDQTGNGNNGQQSWRFTNNTAADFAHFLQYMVHKPVTDHTGLTGHYDFKLRWTPDESHTADPNAPPGLYTALQEQIGLKLEPTRGPVDVFVIDHADKPSEN